MKHSYLSSLYKLWVFVSLSYLGVVNVESKTNFNLFRGLVRWFRTQMTIGSNPSRRKWLFLAVVNAVEVTVIVIKIIISTISTKLYESFFVKIMTFSKLNLLGILGTFAKF